MKELCARFGIDEADLRAAIARDLEKIPFAAGRKFDIHAIPGGASNRGYCRIVLEGADRGIVLMVLSDPDPAKGVEEVMASGVITELPFVNVHRHLAAKNVLLIGNTNHPNSEYYRTIKMMQRYAKDFPWKKFTTHKFPLDKAQEAMEFSLGEKALKVVFDMTKKGKGKK